MKPFCQNKLCRCHIDLPGDMQVMRYTEANGNSVNIGRRQIVKRLDKGYEAFWFCEICANAVAMTFGEKPNMSSSANPLSKSRDGEDTPSGPNCGNKGDANLTNTNQLN